MWKDINAKSTNFYYKTDTHSHEHLQIHIYMKSHQPLRFINLIFY